MTSVAGLCLEISWTISIPEHTSTGFFFSALWRIRNLGPQSEFLAGAGALQLCITEALSEGQDSAEPEMSPPAGGAVAAADPASPVVLMTVHAAVRPLGAGQDAEAQLRRLQLSSDPERPGRFRLGLLGTGPGAVSVGRDAGANPLSTTLTTVFKAVIFLCLSVKTGIMLIPALQIL